MGILWALRLEGTLTALASARHVGSIMGVWLRWVGSFWESLKPWISLSFSYGNSISWVLVSIKVAHQFKVAHRFLTLFTTLLVPRVLWTPTIIRFYLWIFFYFWSLKLSFSEFNYFETLEPTRKFGRVNESETRYGNFYLLDGLMKGPSRLI